MKAAAPSMGPVLARMKSAILYEWSAQIAELSGVEDQFRNPAGHAFRTGLPVLLDAVLGEIDFDDCAAALDELVRIRAVQDRAPAEAIAFISALKPILHAHMGENPVAGRGADRLALLALDSYRKCRARMQAIRLDELRRATFVVDRIAARPKAEGVAGL